jgi:hypothetical protein
MYSTYLLFLEVSWMTPATGRQHKRTHTKRALIIKFNRSICDVAGMMWLWALLSTTIQITCAFLHADLRLLQPSKQGLCVLVCVCLCMCVIGVGEIWSGRWRAWRVCVLTHSRTHTLDSRTNTLSCAPRAHTHAHTTALTTTLATGCTAGMSCKICTGVPPSKLYY